MPVVSPDQIPLAPRILITGAAGFIGGELVERWRRDGAEVHAVSRYRHEPVEGVLWHRADLSSGDGADQVVAAARPTLIYHLASAVTGSRDIAMVRPTFRDNLQSAVNLLLAAAPVGCRVVLAGSLEEPDSVDEPPSSPYAAAKAASGVYARMFHALYELPVVTARMFMVYGPGQRDVRKLVPYVSLALLGKRAPLLTTGRRLVDWIYIDDVVEGLVALGSRPGIEGRRIDLGSGRLTPIRSVVELLARAVPEGPLPVFGALPERPLEVERQADLAATRHAIDWAPQVGLEDGLARTVAWYRRHVAELPAV
jgi:UDP-glucose 4-epimerase